MLLCKHIINRIEQTSQPLIQYVRGVKEGPDTIYYGKVQNSDQEEILDVKWMTENGMKRSWRKRYLLKKRLGKWHQV